MLVERRFDNGPERQRFTQIKGGNAKSDVAKVIMKLWQRRVYGPREIHTFRGPTLRTTTILYMDGYGLGTVRRNQDDTQHCKRHKLMTSECLGLYHGWRTTMRAFRMMGGRCADP
ncbi:hypothetical protein CBL_12355 [Carabus blaptoides fortunei]